MRKCLTPLPLRVLAFVLVATGAAAAPEPLAVLHSALEPAFAAQPDGWQGHSVAVDGNIVVVGSPYADVGFTNSGLAKIYDAVTGVLIHTLVNPNPAPLDYFGMSVAVSGSRVVVGAPFKVAGAANGGIAYAYNLASPTPATPFLTLTNPSPVNFDNFATSVAISGTRVVIGIQQSDTGVTNAGGAYVYDLAGGSPAQPILTLNNPTPLDLEYFGSAVALSGTRVVIGAYGERTVDFFAGAAYVYDLAGPSPHLPALTLNNPTPVGNDYFGIAVGISGSRVVVGARFDGTAGAGSGSAYVYDLAGPTPAAPQYTLTNPSPQSGDSFGVAVGLSGARVLVAAHRDDTGATDAGIAYVFDLAGATPLAPVLTLTNPSPASGDTFGRSVAVAGTHAVIGAPLDDTLAADAGSAYLYDLAGPTPAAATATLNVPNRNAGSQSGNSVSVSGSRVVAGAHLEDIGAANSGVVCVYNLTNAAPAQPVLTLTNPTPAVDDWFGFAVAVSGPRVVVGAPQDDRGATNTGVVHAYDVAGMTPPLPILTLTNPSPAAADLFGYAVAASGPRIVVGVHRDDTGAVDAGLAYVFDLTSLTPSAPVVTLTNPSPALSDFFGWSVGISGPRVVVGALNDDTNAVNSGVAHVYDLAGATPAAPVATLLNPTPVAADGFGSSVAISGPRVVVGTPKDDTGAMDAGTAYVYDLTSAIPTMPVATLTNPSPAVNDLFGSAVAISGTLVVVGTQLDDTGASNAGSAYVYDLSSATPSLPVAHLQSPSPAAGDLFGYSVAIDGAAIVVGEPLDDTRAENGGAAYAFAVRPALGILPAAPGLATLAWTPTNSPGFVLQYADSLAPANWGDAPSGGMNPVTVATTNAARFYRVVKP